MSAVYPPDPVRCCRKCNQIIPLDDQDWDGLQELCGPCQARESLDHQPPAEAADTGDDNFDAEFDRYTEADHDPRVI